MRCHNFGERKENSKNKGIQFPLRILGETLCCSSNEGHNIDARPQIDVICFLILCFSFPLDYFSCFTQLLHINLIKFSPLHCYYM